MPSIAARFRRVAINVFLVFHLIAITCWTLPLNSPLIDAFRSCVRPYMVWTGLFQSWDMFAPLPKTDNSYLQATVITRDGQIHTVSLPRMEQLTLPQKYFKERYRKFAEIVESKTNSALWPDFARHLARPFNNPTNPPEIVLLIRYWSDIPPPGDQDKKPKPELAHIFFEYRLTPEDLK